MQVTGKQKFNSISIMALLALTAVAPCSINEQIYEQTIADYIQTDQYGQWMDLGFIVLSMKTRACTTTESIRILLKNREKERSEAIAAEEAILLNMKLQMDNRIKSGNISGIIKEIYKTNIDFSKQRIEALRKANPSEIGLYKGLDPNMLLGIYVTCKYRISIQWGNAHQEQRETFLLTPDGRKVIGKDKQENAEEQPFKFVKTELSKYYGIELT